jgi:hypothetical protein
MGQRPRASINKAENSSLLSYSIICRISCTYFRLIRGFRFFSQKTSASMSLLLPVSSKNEGNLEDRDPSRKKAPVELALI